MIMGRSLNTIIMQLGTYVLSTDPNMKRKKIMSLWIGMQMDSDGTHSRFVEKAFDFLNTKYDMIIFPIYEANKNDPKAQWHWFTFAVNLAAKKFQILDSLRSTHNADLVEKTQKVRGLVISLWNKITSKHPGCTMPSIFKFDVEIIEVPSSFQQFGIHDCGLFTLMLIQHWDGTRFPELDGYDELKLRKEVLFQLINSPANEICWRDALT